MRSSVIGKKPDTENDIVTEIEKFRQNVNEMYPSLPKKIQVAIDKFFVRTDFETSKILKIKNIVVKNNTQVNKTERSAMSDNVKETNNDSNLKSASDFQASDNDNISMENKFRQYMDVQNEVQFSLF